MAHIRVPCEQMSNSELLRAGFDAWNRDDCEGWLALLDPDVEISTSGVFPDFASSYHGHAQAAKFWRRLREPWGTFGIEVEDMVEDEDTATAQIRFRARGADSGAEVDMSFGSGIKVRDGLATALVNRRTPEEAREALQSIEDAPTVTQDEPRAGEADVRAGRSG